MLFHWLLSIVTPWASVSLAEDELSIRDPVLQEALDAIDIEESAHVSANALQETTSIPLKSVHK